MQRSTFSVLVLYCKKKAAVAKHVNPFKLICLHPKTKAGAGNVYSLGLVKLIADQELLVITKQSHKEHVKQLSMI